MPFMVDAMLRASSGVSFKPCGGHMQGFRIGGGGGGDSSWCVPWLSDCDRVGSLEVHVMVGSCATQV